MFLVVDHINALPPADISTSCRGLFTSSLGIPCAHTLKRLLKIQETLVLDHFHSHEHLQRSQQPFPAAISQPYQSAELRIWTRWGYKVFCPRQSLTMTKDRSVLLTAYSHHRWQEWIDSAMPSTRHGIRFFRIRTKSQKQTLNPNQIMETCFGQTDASTRYYSIVSKLRDEGVGRSSSNCRCGATPQLLCELCYSSIMKFYALVVTIPMK